LVLLAGLVTVGTLMAGPLAALPIVGVLFFALVVARPEYGVALFLSTFLLAYPTALQGAGLLTINNVLGGIFVVLLAYKVYRDEDWWFLQCPELHILGFIILMFYLSSTFNSPDPRLASLMGVQEHGAENLRTFINRTAFVLFFINYIRTPGHVRMIYLLAIVFMVFSALQGIQGVLRGGGLYGYRASTAGAVIAAAFNPNRLAMFSILAIAGLWYLMRFLRWRLLSALVLPAIVVLALCVFMTGSRSGLLGLGVCVAAIAIDERLRLSQLLSIALAGALLVVLVVQFVPQKTFERITNLPLTAGGETGVGASSLERRRYTWDVAIELFQENPVLGVGMGNWELARFIKDPTHSTGAPHSSYLLALVEGGPLCLMGFLVLLWRTWHNLRIVEHYVSVPEFPLAELYWIAKSAKTSFVVLLFFSIFADLWQLVILFWLIGLGITMRRMVEEVAFGTEIVA